LAQAPLDGAPDANNTRYAHRGRGIRHAFGVPRPVQLHRMLPCRHTVQDSFRKSMRKLKSSVRIQSSMSSQGCQQGYQMPNAFLWEIYSGVCRQRLRLAVRNELRNQILARLRIKLTFRVVPTLSKSCLAQSIYAWTGNGKIRESSRRQFFLAAKSPYSSSRLIFQFEGGFVDLFGGYIISTCYKRFSAAGLQNIDIQFHPQHPANASLSPSESFALSHKDMDMNKQVLP